MPQPGGVLAALCQQAANELGALADELRTHEVAIRTRVVNGPAAEVLVDEAAQCRIDLIVMATHYSGPRCQDTDLDQNQWIALLSCAENP